MRTTAVAKKMIKDIDYILFWTIIVVQILFFIFYGYSIYANINRIIFLIIYSLLALIGIINFVTYLVTYHKSNKKVNRFKRFLRVFKYVSNGTMLVINIVELIKYGLNDFSKILLVLSGVFLVAQIIIELIRIFVEKYINLFTIAFEMDFKFIEKISKVKDVKANFFGLVDAPLKAWSNKLEGKKQENNLSEMEEYVNQLAEEDKTKKKEQARQLRKENAEKKKQEIKNHVSIIKKHLFKKKEKVGTSNK
ncbi:MAG: hypothetical protein J1F32_01395 [Erysipelotrichales bacterium]|nr:hypothetical protein [Erysipelotrichales bacterium]